MANLPQSQNQAFLFSSASHEWYTPPAYLVAAQTVLGPDPIELDPASTVQANHWVKAQRFFTEQDNGLSQEWYARTLWLNPPFNQSAKFVSKLLHEYTVGNTTEAILLVKAVLNYRWFAPLTNYPMVITDHRVSFRRPDGSVGDSRLDTAVAFIYFGPKEKLGLFHTQFGQFGYITTLTRPHPPLQTPQNQ